MKVGDRFTIRQRVRGGSAVMLGEVTAEDGNGGIEWVALEVLSEDAPGIAPLLGLPNAVGWRGLELMSASGDLRMVGSDG